MIQWVQIAAGVGALIVIYAWLSVFQRTGRAGGTVTKIVTRVIRRQLSPVPVITFTVEEKKYSFQPSLVVIGEATQKRIGAKVAVAYNPSNPNEAEIATWYRLYLPPVVVTALYAGFLYAHLRAGG